MKDEECLFYKDGKCTETYEEVKKMSLSKCYTCRYNPEKKKMEDIQRLHNEALYGVKATNREMEKLKYENEV